MREYQQKSGCAGCMHASITTQAGSAIQKPITQAMLNMLGPSQFWCFEYQGPSDNDFGKTCTKWRSDNDKPYAASPPPTKAPTHRPARPVAYHFGDNGWFSFSGTIGRQRFFGYFIATLVLALVIALFATEARAPGLMIIVLPLVWISLAAYVKRLRDLDWSPWLVLISLIPYVNIVFFLILLLKAA